MKSNMSFTQFKNIPQVQQKYAIKYIEQNFIQPLSFELSAYFLTEFEFNLANLDVFASEAASSPHGIQCNAGKRNNNHRLSRISLRYIRATLLHSVRE